MIFFGVVFLLAAAPALAYIDPTSGSLILQALLGGVAGILVLLRLYWRKLLGALGLRKEPAPPVDDAR